MWVVLLHTSRITCFSAPTISLYWSANLSILLINYNHHLMLAVRVRRWLNKTSDDSLEDYSLISNFQIQLPITTAYCNNSFLPQQLTARSIGDTKVNKKPCLNNNYEIHWLYNLSMFRSLDNLSMLKHNLTLQIWVGWLRGLRMKLSGTLSFKNVAIFQGMRMVDVTPQSDNIYLCAVFKHVIFKFVLL